MTKLSTPECKQLVKICKRNLVLYYIATTGQAMSGVLQFAAFGNHLIDPNFFRNFVWGLNQGTIQKHVLRMFQASGGTCTAIMTELVGGGELASTAIVIPSGVTTIISVSNINHDIVNFSHYNLRFRFTINPLGSGGITLSDLFFLEVIKP